MFTPILPLFLSLSFASLPGVGPSASIDQAADEAVHSYLQGLDAVSPEAPQLLRQGSYHGDEVGLDAAGDWLALVDTAEGWRLRTVQVEVVPEFDPIVDSEGEESGRRVEVQGSQVVHMLLRGVPELHEGEVQGAQLPGQLLPGDEAVVGIGEPGWLKISALASAAPTGPMGIDLGAVQDFRLVVSHGGLEQELLSYDSLQESMPSVMWAGDLDQDGLLDLIIEESWHYNLSQPALWLSSAAEEGQALGRVTGLASVGC